MCNPYGRDINTHRPMLETSMQITTYFKNVAKDVVTHARIKDPERDHWECVKQIMEERLQLYESHSSLVPQTS